MTESIFYVVEVALPDRDLAEFVPWYAAVHAPHLFQAGFNNCTSYLAVSGGMSVVDIYQAHDWSMFEAPAFERYRGLVFAEPYRPRALAEIANTRTVYHHHAIAPLPSRDPDAPLDADWVCIWRLACDAVMEDRIADWLVAEGASALGAVQVRLLHKGTDAPTGASSRPAVALITEWASQPPAEEALLAALPNWLRPMVDSTQGFVGFRLYPWANNPALQAEAVRYIADAGH